jgi:hypothetical protein
MPPKILTCALSTIWNCQQLECLPIVQWKINCDIFIQWKLYIGGGEGIARYMDLDKSQNLLLNKNKKAEENILCNCIHIKFRKTANLNLILMTNLYKGGNWKKRELLTQIQDMGVSFGNVIYRRDS